MNPKFPSPMLRSKVTLIGFAKMTNRRRFRLRSPKGTR